MKLPALRARLCRVCAVIAVLTPLPLLAQTPKLYGVWNLYSSSSRLSPGVLAFVNFDSAGSPFTVQVGGRPAAVLGSTSGGAYIQVPVELSAGPATIVLTTAGGSSVPLNITLDAYAPTLLTLAGYSSTGSFTRAGPGGATAVNCQSTAYGSNILAIRALGLGATNPAVPTGAPAPLTPPANTVAKPTVTVAGQAVEVLSSILVPGSIGVYEVTFKTPKELPSGFHRVVLSIGGKSSEPVYLPAGATFHNYSTAKVGGWPLWEEWIGAPESMVTVTPCSYAVTFASGAAIGDPKNPPTNLGGTTVKVRDSAGVERLAPLLYVSPFQVNYLIPAGTSIGSATVNIAWGDYVSAGTAVLEIQNVAPALFINQDEDALALLVRLRNGVQTVEPLRAPIDWGPDTDELFVILFGTGLRGRSDVGKMSVVLGLGDRAIRLPVEYAGPQGEIAGLDQLNVRLPRSLKNNFDVLWLSIEVDGNKTNQEMLIHLNYR